MRVLSALLILVLFCAVPAQAQSDEIEAMRSWSSAVGQQMYSYFQAQYRATEAIEAEVGPVDWPELHAATPTDGGWTFSFGHLDEDGTYFLRYGIVVEEDGTTKDVSHFEEAHEASTAHTLQARALAAVIDTFQTHIHTDPSFQAPSYRVAVLPFPSGEITAIVAPTQTDGTVIHAGNDMMYRLDRADASIVNEMRFHHRLIELPLDRSSGISEEVRQPALIVPDAPFPSPVDVLNAMEHEIEMVVLTQNGVLTISETGTINAVPDEDPLAEALYERAEQ